MDTDDIYVVDYAYWLQVPLWTFYEAARLLLGINPNFIAEEVSPFDLLHHSPEVKDVNEKLLDLCRILERAQLAGELGKSNAKRDSNGGLPPLPAREWITWAKRNQVDCPSKLTDALAKPSTSDEHNEDDIHPRRETTLLRIIGALLEELQSDGSRSQAAIVRIIVHLHGNKPGISVSTIENIFSQANRRLIDW